MSFAGIVKEELVKQIPAARHCQIAELAAILHFCAVYEAPQEPGAQPSETRTLAPLSQFPPEIGDFAQKKRENQEKLLIQAENPAVVRKCFTLLGKTFKICTGIEGKNTGRSGIGQITLTDSDQIHRVLQAAKYMDGDGHVSGLKRSGSRGEQVLTDVDLPVNEMLLKNSCCQRSFLRGAFLSAGTMSDPGKSYHLEIVCSGYAEAEQIRDVLHAFGVASRIVQRKRYHVVYMKDGSGISDFLSIIEAHVSMMDFENHRILKDVRNTLNRRVNCEAANIGKTVSASSRQVEDILYLKESCGLDSLPENLRQVAEARLENPDMSLRELGECLDPPVGKSGVNHRLRKLGELADRLREAGAVDGSISGQ